MPLAAVIFGLGLWVFSEIFVFGLVADAIGVSGAIVATLLTSLVGLALLRRLGHAARDEITAIFRNGGRLAPEALQSGFRTALGSILLVLPGFLSDLVGLALLAPGLRRPHEARPQSRPQDPEIIDLPPQDWRRIDEA